MKKGVFVAVAAIGLTLGLAACNEDDEAETTSSSEVEVVQDQAPDRAADDAAPATAAEAARDALTDAAENLAEAARNTTEVARSKVAAGFDRAFLTVENFDLTRAQEAVDQSELSEDAKTTVKTAMEKAANSPAALDQVLSRVRSLLGGEAPGEGSGS